ncbi:apoptosis regulator Bcl-2a [Tachysurus ichikawai]
MVHRAGRDDELGYFLVPNALISGDILGGLRQQPVEQHTLWVLAAMFWLLPCGFSSLLSEILQDREQMHCDAFVELYSHQRASIFHPWPYLKTVFGLAALGAAGVTIGALFSQK